MRSFQHQTWQVWPEEWYGKSLLLLVPAFRKKRSKTVFGHPGQFQHATSFLTGTCHQRCQYVLSGFHNTAVHTEDVRGTMAIRQPSNGLQCSPWWFLERPHLA